MNYKIILLAAFAMLLTSCSENDSQKTEVNVPPDTQSHELPTVVDRSKDVPKSDSDATAVTPQHIEKPEADKELPAADYSHVFSINEQDIVLGDKDSQIMLFEYSSPTCPHCSYYHKEVLPELKKKYIDTGKIVYIFREFIGNKLDLDAAILGRCYKNDKDPLKLFDVIYTSQENWVSNKNYREILGNLGQLAGITTEKYKNCLNNGVITMFLVNNSRAISSFPSFVGTPAFFINGHMHKGAYNVEGLSHAIEEAIKGKKKKTQESNKSSDTEAEKNNGQVDG